MKNKKLYLKIFACIYLVVILLLPYSQSNASISTDVIEVNDDSSSEIKEDGNLSIETRNINKYVPSPSSFDDSYLIPDLELRKYINKNLLRKTGDEIETYSATIEDLESITSIGLVGSTNQLLVFESLEGMQYMKNATYLRLLNVSIPESGLEIISQMTLLDRVVFNSMIFGGTDGTLRRFNISVNDGEVLEEVHIPFDQYIDLSPLAKLPNLTDLYFTLNGMQQDGAFTYSNRTHFDVSGLGTLINLTSLKLQSMGSVDDPTFSFLSSLTQLKSLSLIGTPLNDVTAISNLKNLTALNISETYVTDFTPIIDKPYFTGASSMKINFPVEFYDTKEIDGEDVNIISIDTGITLGENIDTIGFTTVSSHVGVFGINNYAYDDSIKLDFNINELKVYNLLNWETGQYDLKKLGFVWGANITTASGKNIGYSINTMTVGKKVIFDANFENGGSVEVLFDPFELIKEPTVLSNARIHLDFVREGYEVTGWALDIDGIELFDFLTEHHTNIVLYAQWKTATIEPVDPPPTTPDIVNPTPDELPNAGAEYTLLYISLLAFSCLGMRLTILKNN